MGESPRGSWSLTPFNKPDEWIFASPYTKGKRPFWPAQLLKSTSSRLRWRLGCRASDNPSMLGEDLLIVSSEFRKFDKSKVRPDVLALSRNGQLVIVELKRDAAGTSADLQ